MTLASTANQLSAPLIRYYDTLTLLSTDITPERPVSVRIVNERRSSASESFSGRVETHYYFGRATIEMSWDFVVGDPDLSLGGYANGPFYLFRRLWNSCGDGTPFHLWIHSGITSGGYPQGNSAYPDHDVHDNYYYVRFHPEMKELPVENQDGVKDRYRVTLKLQEVVE